jgi:O-antigen ligase
MRTSSIARIGGVTGSKEWQSLADVWPALIALVLPWSTSAVAFILVIWLIGVFGMIRTRPFVDVIVSPASLLPVAFFLLGVLGTIWTPDTWSTRLQGLLPLLRLLLLPLFFYQFSRSSHAHWVFCAFLASCTLLMALSWVIFFFPQLRFTSAHGFDVTGIPVKNAIDQSYEFALCCFGLIYALWSSIRQRQFWLSVLLVLLLGGFVLNLLFVAFSRTTVVYALPIVLFFAFKHFKGRSMVGLLVAIGASILVAWFSSPFLRDRLTHVTIEYQEFQETNRPTSLGQRLAFWGFSMKWIEQAPVLGNGTGSTKGLFDKEAVGKDGAWSQSIRNPHNQTLYVAIQWGLVGCLLLYSMWFTHLRLFRGVSFAEWIGGCVVLQNMLGSLLNSHLFDFVEGWIYVLGVGIAGGLMSKSMSEATAAPPLAEAVPMECRGAIDRTC